MTTNQPAKPTEPEPTVTIVGRSTPEFERNLAEFKQWQAQQRAERDRC